MNVPEIARRLKELRKDILKLSLEKMRELTGLSISGIATMESGSMKPSATYLHGLAQAFNVNINWVLTGKGAPFKPDIEMNLGYGRDDEMIKEFLESFDKLPLVRFEFLTQFALFKSKNKKLFTGNPPPAEKPQKPAKKS